MSERLTNRTISWAIAAGSTLASIDRSRTRAASRASASRARPSVGGRGDPLMLSARPGATGVEVAPQHRALARPASR